MLERIEGIERERKRTLAFFFESQLALFIVVLVLSSASIFTTLKETLSASLSLQTAKLKDVVCRALEGYARCMRWRLGSDGFGGRRRTFPLFLGIAVVALRSGC